MIFSNSFKNSVCSIILETGYTRLAMPDGILIKLGTNVQLIDTMCRTQISAMSVWGQGHIYRSVFCLCSTTSQCMMGFWLHLAQIIASLTWCAEPNFQPCWSEVKVAVKLCLLHNFAMHYDKTWYKWSGIHGIVDMNPQHELSTMTTWRTGLKPATW